MSIIACRLPTGAFVKNRGDAYYSVMAENKELRRLRDRIDDADRELLDALGRRMKLAKEAGEYKKANNIPLLDPKRESEIMSTRAGWGSNRGLSTSFVRELFERIVKHARELQK